jgi:hypothetical protein
MPLVSCPSREYRALARVSGGRRQPTGVAAEGYSRRHAGTPTHLREQHLFDAATARR